VPCVAQATCSPLELSSVLRTKLLRSPSNDLGRESVSVVPRCLGVHRRSLPVSAST
jgi:hypothetical protein